MLTHTVLPLTSLIEYMIIDTEETLFSGPADERPPLFHGSIFSDGLVLLFKLPLMSGNLSNVTTEQ